MAEQNKNISNSSGSTSIAMEALDLIFRGRNKDYGAYELRKNYWKHLRKGLLITLGVLTALLLFRFLSAKFSASDSEKPIDIVAELGPPPSIDPNTPPPPPPPPLETPPPRPSVKFVPPVVKKDEEVTDTVQIARVEELKEADPGTTTVEGDKNSTVIAELPPDLGQGDEKVEEPKVFTFAEQMPAFPGGQKEMYEYIYKNIKYPAIARENGIEGSVVLQFVVDESGKIGKITTVRDIGAGCGDEAIRVVKNMPQWIPGKQNGKPVRVQMTLPIKYKLE